VILITALLLLVLSAGAAERVSQKLPDENERVLGGFDNRS
jgi:hypothetical protein